MIPPPATIGINENMEDVLKKFDDFNEWNLPVTDNKHYIGFVSKSKIFTHYRQFLIKDTLLPG